MFTTTQTGPLLQSVLVAQCLPPRLYLCPCYKQAGCTTAAVGIMTATYEGLKNTAQVVGLTRQTKQVWVF